MKKILILLIILVLSGFAIAEDQPRLLNHQFYGEVTWAKDSPVPSTLTATLNDNTFTAEIRSSPCLEDSCHGKYGYDSDNILRVQDSSGTIHFAIDGVDVGEYQYQEDTVTKLDFDLRPEEATQTSSSTSGSGSGNAQETSNATIVPTPTQPEQVVPQPEPVKVTPKSVPTFKLPPTPAPAKAAQQKGGLNPYLIGGIVLLLAAIGIVTFLIIKKRREAEQF